MPKAFANLDLICNGKHITANRDRSKFPMGGQMFPGGGVDQVGGASPPDRSMRHAALREFNEETGKKFEAFLKSKGLTFKDVEKSLDIIGMMDTTKEGKGDVGLHVNYQLDLNQLFQNVTPPITPPVTVPEIDEFVKSLSPSDDLAGGDLASRTDAEMGIKYSAGQFKGGFRTAAYNLTKHNGTKPTLIEYHASPPHHTEDLGGKAGALAKEAEWEKQLSLASSLATSKAVTGSPASASKIGVKPPSAAGNPAKPVPVNMIIDGLKKKFSSQAEISFTEKTAADGTSTYNLTIQSKVGGQAAAFDGNIKLDGSGSVNHAGAWDDEKTSAFVNHMVDDLGWKEIELASEGPNAINPPALLAKAIRAIQTKDPSIKLKVGGESAEDFLKKHDAAAKAKPLATGSTGAPPPVVTTPIGAVKP